MSGESGRNISEQSSNSQQADKCVFCGKNIDILLCHETRMCSACLVTHNNLSRQNEIDNNKIPRRKLLTSHELLSAQPYNARNISASMASGINLNTPVADVHERKGKGPAVSSTGDRYREETLEKKKEADTEYYNVLPVKKVQRASTFCSLSESEWRSFRRDSTQRTTVRAKDMADRKYPLRKTVLIAQEKTEGVYATADTTATEPALPPHQARQKPPTKHESPQQLRDNSFLTKTDIRHSGYLKKKSKAFRGHWRKRFFFLLNDGQFLGFETDKPPMIHARFTTHIYDVTGAELFKRDLPKRRRTFLARCIEVIPSSGKERQFYAQSETDRTDWLNSIYDLNSKLKCDNGGKP